MRWVTRQRPKVDRLASPWLIKRFVDPQAEFLFVPVQEMRQAAIRRGAIPFDLPDGRPEVELVHPPGGTSFDVIRAQFDISDPAVARIAALVRAAGNDNLARRNPQAGGLRAISLGLAKSVKDDNERLACGMVIYDALYQWAQKLAPEEEAASLPLLSRAGWALSSWVSRQWDRRGPGDLSAHLCRDIGLTCDEAQRGSETPWWRP